MKTGRWTKDDERRLQAKLAKAAKLGPDPRQIWIEGTEPSDKRSGATKTAPHDLEEKLSMPIQQAGRATATPRQLLNRWGCQAFNPKNPPDSLTIDSGFHVEVWEFNGVNYAQVSSVRK